jgi:serine/threonine-protein kinase
MMVTSNVRLVRPLGAGGMGSVWVAEHLSLRTDVVVKFMARDLADSQEAIGRFSREAAAASQVKSPHVVQMFDHGVGEDGRPYIVMELLEGTDLEHRLRACRKLDASEVVAIVAQLARALSKAHERGIVHRDIKPSNVFLIDAGGGELFVKLLDFGIAKGPEVGIVGSTTKTGSFVGSPYYMSPEQVIGAKTVDFRSDLWSLGVVVYEALTGEKPFYAETVGALALRIHRDPIPAPTTASPGLPAALDAWFFKACARAPEERFGSAKEMAEALAQALTGESIPPALRVESVPTPRRPALGLETTERAASGETARDASTMRSRADARSETGAGAGIVTSSSLPGVTRSRWWMAAFIGVAAVGIGFLVPRLFTGEQPAAPAQRGVGAEAAVAVEAAALGSSTIGTAATAPPPTQPPVAASSAPPPAARPWRPPPTKSAVPAASSAPPAVPPPTPSGSDDDIK